MSLRSIFNENCYDFQETTETRVTLCSNFNNFCDFGEKYGLALHFLRRCEKIHTTYEFYLDRDKIEIRIREKYLSFINKNIGSQKQYFSQLQCKQFYIKIYPSDI